jgi:hypothetical protein
MELPSVAPLRNEQPRATSEDLPEVAPKTLSKVAPLPLSSPPTKILGFDLENRPLAYWYDGNTTSEITAIGWKWVGERNVHTLMLRNDGYFEGDFDIRLPGKAAYELFSETLAEADVVFGHNIRKHDLPIFQAGLLRRELPPLQPVLTTDTLRDIPKKGGMSASLANLSAMYGLEGEKQSMSHTDWELSNRLTDEGISLARGRVVGDVLLQEQLRAKLLDLGILKAPRMWTP